MAYYLRNAVSGTNETQFTKSLWLKRGDNDNSIHQVWSIGGATASEGFMQLRFNDDNGGGTLRVSGEDNSSGFNLFTKSKFMDSQWMHLVIRYDGSQSTNADKLKFYVNGDQIEDSDWDTSPSKSYPTASSFPSTFYDNDIIINASRSPHSQDGDAHYAEMYFVDGQSLAPSVFAETDSTTGKWRAKGSNAVRTAISSFGNNGYYLSFQDATSTTTLGYDYQTADRSGTTNDFTANGSVIYGSNSSPDNDFPIMNEMTRDYSGWDFDHGGLKITTNDTGTLQDMCLASKHLPRSGKWYWEVKLLDLSTTSTGGTGNYFGVSTTGEREYVRWSYGHNGSANGNNIESDDGNLYTIGSGGTNYPSVNDWYGFGIDIDNNTFKVYQNGTLRGTGTYNWNDKSVQNYIPYFRNDEGVSGRGSSSLFNFGQGIVDITRNSGNGYSDDNGQGKFQYEPPSGYLAICDANITDVTIDPSEHCNLVYYDGNATDDRAITLGFQPDLILSKRSETSSTSWYWIDSIRGAGKPLQHGTATQGNETQQLKSFTSTGVTIGVDGNINGSGTNGYLMAGWKGGGTAVSNTDGTLTSTVSANPTAGFSVVKYVVTSGDYTVGHGLGKKPDLIILKGGYDSNTYNWDVYTPDNNGTGGAGYRLKLNNTDERESSTNAFKNEPTSTVFSQNSAHYAVGNKNIAYCFTGIEGYSQFGYFNGRSNSHVMIHTGFTPLFVVVKPYVVDGTPTTGWRWFDRTLAPYANQGSDNALYMNTSGNKVSQNGVDFHSNGFSVYGEGDQNINKASSSYFYMAFASLPAEFARGIG